MGGGCAWGERSVVWSPAVRGGGGAETSWWPNLWLWCLFSRYRSSNQGLQLVTATKQLQVTCNALLIRLQSKKISLRRKGGRKEKQVRHEPASAPSRHQLHVGEDRVVVRREYAPARRQRGHLRRLSRRQWRNHELGRDAHTQRMHGGLVGWKALLGCEGPSIAELCSVRVV